MGVESIDTGVLGGILAGGVAAWAFNRFYKIQLPEYLGFFAGKRAVPIITGFVSIGLGVILCPSSGRRSVVPSVPSPTGLPTRTRFWPSVSTAWLSAP